MYRIPQVLAVFALAALLGCQGEKHNLAVEFPEEYTLPPDEPRFNNPPESGYKKPPPKKEFKPGMGNGPGGFSNTGVPGGR
jgi:hypothetical protein